MENINEKLEEGKKKFDNLFLYDSTKKVLIIKDENIKTCYNCPFVESNTKLRLENERL